MSNDLVRAFAAMCNVRAQWRLDKLEKHGDARNRRCADALRAAATWALASDDPDDRLGPLVGTLSGGEGFLVLAPEADRILSSFCLDKPEALDDWLGRVCDAQTREDFDDDDLGADSELR